MCGTFTSIGSRNNSSFFCCPSAGSPARPMRTPRNTIERMRACMILPPLGNRIVGSAIVPESRQRCTRLLQERGQHLRRHLVAETTDFAAADERVLARPVRVVPSLLLLL